MKKVNYFLAVPLVNLIFIKGLNVRTLEVKSRGSEEEKIKILKKESTIAVNILKLEQVQGRNITDLICAFIDKKAELSKTKYGFKVGLFTLEDGFAYLGAVCLGAFEVSWLLEYDSFLQFVRVNDLEDLVGYEYPATNDDRPADPITLSKYDL
tara:strand:- start:2689 stop:3147 length:459 start_codon:yes stop_codon:yes gene_type:complete